MGGMALNRLCCGSEHHREFAALVAGDVPNASYKPAASFPAGFIRSANVTTFYRGELPGTSWGYIGQLYERISVRPRSDVNIARP
jgi:hypothetical protein